MLSCILILYMAKNLSVKDKLLIRNLSFAGAIFAIVFGTLLHFTYQWSGDSVFVGLFSPINESVWEHLKLVVTPLILFGFIDYYYLRAKVSNYCFALAKEVGIATVVIVGGFYLYTAILGTDYLLVDIALFVIAVILAKWGGYVFLIGKFKRYEFKGINAISAVLLIIYVGLIMYFTFSPPKIDVFKDPETGTYGINYTR